MAAVAATAAVVVAAAAGTAVDFVVNLRVLPKVWLDKHGHVVVVVVEKEFFLQPKHSHKNRCPSLRSLLPF